MADEPVMEFHGDGQMVDVEWESRVHEQYHVPDELEDEHPARGRERHGPHVFDWCLPWRPASQHAKCRKSYTTTVDLNRGRGHPKWQTVTVRCECPRCHHTPEEGATP